MRDTDLKEYEILYYSGDDFGGWVKYIRNSLGFNQRDFIKELQNNGVKISLTNLVQFENNKKEPKHISCEVLQREIKRVFYKTARDKGYEIL